MKIYAEYHAETDGVDIVLNYRELKKLVDSLTEFEALVKRFKAKNKGVKNLGHTHLHTQDCGIAGTGKYDNSDVVFYVNLDE